MKITFLGSGAAFTLDNYQSNMLIEENGVKALFDCGGDVRWALKEKDLTLLDIDAVYVSHLHADHTGGLEGLAFMSYFTSGKDRPTLYVNKDLENDLWNNTLSGGLNCIQLKDTDLNTFYDVCPVDTQVNFDIKKTKDLFINDSPGISCRLVQSVHVVANTQIKKSYGLFLFTHHLNKKIYITGDTQFSPAQVRSYIKSADIVFHDCETVPYEYSSGVHAHYEELKVLPEELKSKIWLYHWNGSYEKLPDAKADGFAGFVKKGQEFEL